MEKKTGLLLINTGSPDSCSTAGVRRYLREFLMDPRVLDVPAPLRALIVYGAILPFRPARSAAAYREIWTAEGSPLVAITKRLAERLRGEMEIPVAIAMRYGSLTPARALRQLSREDVHDVVLLPMFPHYAMSSYESAIEHVKQAARSHDTEIALHVIPPYYRHPAYIEALADSARPYVTHGFDHVLFSYHGMPVRHLRKVNSACGDCQTFAHHDSSAETCYQYQTIQTTQACAQALGLDRRRYSIAYQSRLGQDRWLEPSTVSQLERLARSGVHSLAVICPSFTVDCLETLEEIAMRGKDVFLGCGGKEFQLIPALNDNPVWAGALTQIIAQAPSAAAP